MTGWGTERDPQPPGLDALTDPAAMRAGDRYRVLSALATAGAQVRALAEQVASAAFERPRSLIVLEPVPSGDGALGAALLTNPRAPVLLGTSVPSWVGPLDLVVVLAGSPDDGAAAELAAEAARRGAALVVRGAENGPVAAAAGRALLAPRVAAPEIAAGPSRVALVLATAMAADMTPAGRDPDGSVLRTLEAIADALDAEALACGPTAEPFVNPAIALAVQLQAGSALLVGDDPAGMALARRGARALRLLGGLPAAAEHAGALLAGGQLTALLARRDDPFADPLLDGPTVAAPVPLLVESPDGAPRRDLAALARTLPRAVVLAADEPGDPPAARALAVALRIDFAAAYLGIAAGQVPPGDSPDGLGPTGGVRDAHPATTVDDVPTRDAGDDRWS